METYICTKCGEEKPAEEFRMVLGRHKNRRRNRACVTCMQQYKRKHYESHHSDYLDRSKAWREANPEQFHATVQACYRKNGEAYRLKQAEYQKTEKGRENSRRSSQNYRDKHTEYRLKYAARVAVREAVIKGLLYRPESCSRCGKKCKPEAHHPDYSKPLEVVWLCSKCHGETKCHLNEEHSSKE